METFKLIAEKIQKDLQKGNNNALIAHGNEFSEHLVDNFYKPYIRELSIEALKEFELCCLIFEYNCLHRNIGSDIIFALDQVTGHYSELSFLRSRLSCLRFPDQINNIENEWQASLKLFLIEYMRLEELDSILLSPVGKKVFIDRCGIKVMSQLSTLLKQVNLPGELPSFLTRTIMEIEDGASHLVRVLGWTTQENSHDIRKELFNI